MPVLDKPFAVAAAVHSLVNAALPLADVRHDPAKAFTVKANGAAAVWSGEAEEQPDSLLGSALLHHAMPVMLSGVATETLSTLQVTRAMVALVEAAVSANRTLNGLVDWLWVSPEFSGLTAAEVFGAEATDWLTLTLMAEYSVAR